MKTPTHNPTPGTLHAPCTYASMQSVLVKIASPAQTPAPCDQRTARVRARVDLCLDLLAKVLRSATVRSAILREENRVSLDLLAKVLRSATVRSAILREENRVSLGPPAQKSAPCELRGARCDRRNRTACATVCELRAVLCELQSCLSTCLASMLRAAICELRLATGPQLADCGSRIAARGFAARPSSSVDTMRTCLASILRAAICDVHLADGLQLADCGSQNAGWPPGSGSSAGIRRGLQVARRSSQDATQRHEVNGLLHTFSDS